MPDSKRHQILGDRQRALEEAFFSKHNAELREKMLRQREERAARDELMEISGLGEGPLLDKLHELGIGGGTWAALSLIPLVEVAWANGQVDAKERRAVLEAAEANGISADTPGFQLLGSWLDHRPDGRLLQAWGEYVIGLCASMGEAEKAAFRSEVMDRARTVAEAAGGILGFGNKVSPEEEVVLSQLEKAFAR